MSDILTRIEILSHSDRLALNHRTAYALLFEAADEIRRQRGLATCHCGTRFDEDDRGACVTCAGPQE